MSAAPVPAALHISLLDGITAETTPHACSKCHLSGRRYYEGLYSSGPLVCRHAAETLPDAELADLMTEVRALQSARGYVRNHNELMQTADELRHVESMRDMTRRLRIGLAS